MKAIRFFLSFAAVTFVIVSLIGYFEKRFDSNKNISEKQTPPLVSNKSSIATQDKVETDSKPTPLPSGAAAQQSRFNTPAPDKIELFYIGARAAILHTFTDIESAVNFCPEKSSFATLKNSVLNADGKPVSMPGCIFDQDSNKIYRYFDFHAGGPRDLVVKEPKLFESSETADYEVRDLNRRVLVDYKYILEYSIKQVEELCEGYRFAKNIDLYEFCTDRLNKKRQLFDELIDWGFVDSESLRLCNHATNMQYDSLNSCFIASFEMCRDSLDDYTDVMKCHTTFTNGQWLSNPKARMNL